MIKDGDELSLLLELCQLGHAAVAGLRHGGTDPREDELAALGRCFSALQGLLENGSDPDVWLEALEARHGLRRRPTEAAAPIGTFAESAVSIESVESAGPAQSGATATQPISFDRPDTLEALNGIAALLVRSRIGDAVALETAAAELLRLADRAELTDELRSCLKTASARVAALLSGASADPAQDYLEASRLVEFAAEALCEPAPIDPARAPRDSGRVVGPDAPNLPGPVGASGIPGPGSGAGAAPAAVPAGAGLPPDADLSLLADFVTECRDYVEKAEAALLDLEIDPNRVEEINTVFRAFHTIKGTSGFLGLPMIADLAHKSENLLCRVRDREIRCAGGYADLALRALDQIKVLVEGVSGALAGGPLVKPPGYDDLLAILADPEAAGISADSGEAIEVPRLGDLLVASGKADRQAVERAASDHGPEPIGRVLVKSGVVRTEDVVQALRVQKRMAETPESAAVSSVRIRTDRLDRLIDTVGELVIAQSMVAQDEGVTLSRRPELVRKVGHLGKIVRDLQDLSMSMRMVPLKATFQKMARLVRDLAHKSGRAVEFGSLGEDTEIDRNMVDVIADPLVHMIRNAVDHGIELPEDRERSGKARSGRIELSAYRAGGNIAVELRDDGRGLDRARIVRKAIDRGLLDSDKGLSDGAVYNLIFEPGLSTAERVTEVSGRGVGMDVVRRAVQALRGRVDIESQSGAGTTFTIKLPLTLAVTDGMLVQVGAQRLIIPTASIHLTFRPDRSALSTVAGRGEMAILRDGLLPLVRLHRILGISGAIEDPTLALLVVVEDGRNRAAFLVDELLGQQQVVAKSLGDAMGEIRGVAGGAILGDGRVGLILDPSGLIALAREGSADPAAIGARAGQIGTERACLDGRRA